MVTKIVKAVGMLHLELLACQISIVSAAKGEYAKFLGG